MTGGYENKKVLITVKTYPTPSQKTVESSCTAGITDDGRWIRLYPIPFRLLLQEKRFSKYQWITVNVVKSRDPRPESYHVDFDSIVVSPDKVASKNKWQARKDIVYPLASRSLCELKRAQDRDRTSLGFFKPKRISSFQIEAEENPDWTPEQRDKLEREDLFLGKTAVTLEKVPHKFYYSFECDDPECPGVHRLSCYDWELGEAYRRWKSQYGAGWEDKFRDKFEHEMIDLNETHFFVGTLATHPDTWIIVGLFYPRK